jgi:hypothetical protein
LLLRLRCCRSSFFAFLALGFFYLFATFLGFRSDGMSMNGIDDVFKRSGVCAFFPSDDFGGMALVWCW